MSSKSRTNISRNIDEFLKNVASNSKEIVFHQTGSEQAKKIYKYGFVIRKFAEKRRAVYAAGNNVNDLLYSRTAEGEIYYGQKPTKIPIDIRGLILYDATNLRMDNELGASIIRGDLDKLSKEYDGTIKFLPNGDVYEVALPPELASKRILTKKKLLTILKKMPF